MSSKSFFDSLLRHPLFLIIVTGLVTGLIIPYVTAEWQNHQKAVDTRAHFGSDITESVVKLVLAVQLAERKQIPQAQYDQAYQDWEIKRAILATQLRGQFRDPQLAVHWTNLSEAVTKIYVLSGTWGEPYRSQVIGDLKAYFTLKSSDWDLLQRHDARKHSTEVEFQNYFKAWWSLREAALLRTGDFVKEVLEARTSSYDSNVFSNIGPARP